MSTEMPPHERELIERRNLARQATIDAYMRFRDDLDRGGVSSVWLEKLKQSFDQLLVEIDAKVMEDIRAIEGKAE